MGLYVAREAIGDKHRELHNGVIDVKAHFGAKGDGTTDDTVAIQAAISASAGRSIYFPAGTYIAAGIDIMFDNLRFFGEGMASVIKLRNGANTHLFTHLGGASANRFFVTFENLRLDGNRANNSSGHIVRAYSAHTWLFDRIHFQNAADSAIKFEGQSSSFLALNNVVRNCRIEGSTNQALFFGAFAPNNHVESNIIGGVSNWYCIEDANAENKFIGNHIHTSAGHGIYLNGATNPIVEGNYVESSNQSGIKVESTTQGARIIGNVCFNNGLTSAGDGINVAGTDCSVMGNRCFDRQGTKTQDYGIQLTAASARVLVVGNHARTADNQTGGILDSGTGNTLANNQTT